MKRKKSGWLLLCLFGVLVLCACGKKTDVKEGEAYIYCLNEDRTGLTKVQFENPETEPLAAAKAVLAEMKKPSEDITYTAPLPEGVNVQACMLESGVLTVDFSKEYGGLSAIEEKLVRAAIVQSIVQIDGISALWFNVDGESLKDKDGQILGFQNEDDFVQNMGSALSSYQTATLTLYFANETGDGLVSQQMDVKYSSNVSKEKLIVEKLMKGPRKGAYPTINTEVSLLSVTIKDGICYVNFDSEFLVGGLDVMPEVTIYSIVNSLVDGTDAEKVQIMVNGESNFSYMETVDLTQPLEKDESWEEKK